MKVLLLFFIITNVFAIETLTIHFKNEQDKRDWIEWYLDKNGEELSDFIAIDWDNENLVLVKEETKPLSRIFRNQ